jgi:hypothetical protein
VGNEFGVKGGVTGQYHAVGDGELKCVGGLVDGEFEVKSGVIGQPHVIGGQVIVFITKNNLSSNHIKVCITVPDHVLHPLELVPFLQSSKITPPSHIHLYIPQTNPTTLPSQIPNHQPSTNAPPPS